MSEEKALAKTNFDHIRALARSDEVLSRFAEVLGPTAPTFISSLLIAVQGNDKLTECTPASIIAAGMRAATLRLSCDPALGQAYPVPYFDNKSGKYKAQFQIGYKGMIQLALRTGKYRILNVAPVYEGQTVVEDQLRGIHNITGFRTSKTVVGYMLYFQLISGFEKTDYMTVDEILEHAQHHSKTFNQERGFWKTNTADMMKKTVLLHGLRRWGYFDPSDQMNMGPTAPETDTEQEEEFDGIDLEFQDGEYRESAENAYKSLMGEEMPENQKPGNGKAEQPGLLGKDAEQEPKEFDPVAIEKIAADFGQATNRIKNALAYCHLPKRSGYDALKKWMDEYRKARDANKSVPDAAAEADKAVMETN